MNRSLDSVAWSVALAAASALSPVPLLGQSTEPLRIETTLPADGWVDADETISIRFGRPLDAPTERVAVFFDHVDVTDLFRVTRDALAYGPAGPRLPRGEGELVVWRVSAAGWEEIGREPLRVRDRLGFETAEWDPGVDLSVEGPLGGGEDPAPDIEAEGFDQQLSGQLVLSSTHTRGDLSIVGETSLLGASDRRDALRFSEKGEDAARIDLSSYRLEVGGGPVSFALGHVGFGDQRHLIRGFDSRGAVVSWAPSPRADVGVSIMGGNSTVGFDDLLGFGDPDHRLTSASFGLEALERRGGLRLELTWLDASVLPGRTGFNQGAIDDAEESRGVGVSVSTETPGRRLRLEGGFARSRYDNPFDPTLAQGDELVPVEEETRNARYIEATAGIFDRVEIGDSKTLDVDLVLRHERVDPQYRSVGTFVRADQHVDDLQLRGRIADVDLQISHARSADNLDELPNVLTTRTRRTGIQAGLPLARVLNVEGAAAPWVPQLRFRHDRTHQFGDGIPENSGFDASHVPDQVSSTVSVDVGWRWRKASFAWRLNLSDQDNRQQGREDADLKNRVNGFTLGLQPWDRVSVDVQLGLERRENIEREEIDDTRRWAVRTTLTPYASSQVSLSWSTTHVEDRAGTRARDATNLDAQWSSAIPRLDRVGGQWFVRFSRSFTERIDRPRELLDERSDWSVDSGLSFSLFK